MTHITLYSATSLNNKIASADGSVDWLEKIDHPEGEDYGYRDFYASVDTTIMGNGTFRQLMDWDVDWPYPDKKNYVLTRQKEPHQHQQVEFIVDDHIERIEAIKQQSQQGIWLIGGGQVNTLLLNAGLIDRMIIHLMPIVLPDGIDLFESGPKETNLRLVGQKQYGSGVVELHYRKL